MLTLSATVTLPAPPTVRFCVPVMALPVETLRLRVPASELMREAPAKVIKPEIVLSPEMLRRAPPELMPVPVRLIASALAGVAVSSSAALFATVVEPLVLPRALASETRSAPALTLMAPEKELLLPESVRVFAPALAKAPLPVMAPEKVELAPTVVVKLPTPRLRLPAPESAPTVSLMPFRSKVAPLPIESAEESEMLPPVPKRKVPALTVVAPV